MQSHLLDDTVMEEALSAVRRAIADEEAGGPALAPAAATLRQSSEGDGPGLLSKEATTAIGSTVDRLTTTLRTQQPSLEDLVRETLRPMLKSWLDENLSGVVERMVQIEIERVIRGR